MNLPLALGRTRLCALLRGVMCLTVMPLHVRGRTAAVHPVVVPGMVSGPMVVLDRHIGRMNVLGAGVHVGRFRRGFLVGSSCVVRLSDKRR